MDQKARARRCKNCRAKLIKQKKFCSNKCYGLARRGSGKSHIMIRVNGERVYLHRYVFETEIRPLQPGEIVHDKDENRFNNSAENLEALSGRAAHLHIHDYHRNRRQVNRVEPVKTTEENSWLDTAF